MDLHAALAFHLFDLIESLGNDSPADALAALVGDLSTAVPSYVGLRLSLVLDEWPVTLTAFVAPDGARTATSLRLALSIFGPGFDPASRVVFYAGTPGTFVDLAADLAYLHGRLHVTLDVELPPPTVVPGFSGLSEYAVVNRALGVLLERGQDTHEARSTLYRGASAAGMDLPGYAARLLER